MELSRIELQKRYNMIMQEHYSRPDIKFEIIKFTDKREFAMLVPNCLKGTPFNFDTRYRRCHSVQHIDFFMIKMLDIFNRYKETFRVTNLYHSLARYKDGLPLFSPNIVERNTTDWLKNHHKSMIEYDWLIDVDSPSHKHIYWAHETATEIKRLFDSYDVHYQLRFSGCGFHFIVPHREYAYLNKHFNPWIDGSVFEFLTKFSKRLNERYSELIDWKIPDSRRVVKIPYSLAFYDEKVFMCIPFMSDKEFDDFNLDDMAYDRWNDVRNRGSFTFNHDKVSRFQELVNAFGVDKDSI